VRKASKAVIEIMNMGIGICELLSPISPNFIPFIPTLSNSTLHTTECIELVDAAFMRATKTVGNPARKYDIADHLFFKLQGATPGALSESVEVAKKIVRKHGGDKFWPAKVQEEAEAVWTDRKNVLYTGLAYAGEGAKALRLTTDVWCVSQIIISSCIAAREGKFPLLRECRRPQESLDLHYAFTAEEHWLLYSCQKPSQWLLSKPGRCVACKSPGILRTS
jgi:hypothetical protein